ncbi:MAG: hypothetical protein MAG431_00785 [Chloroflexi bacterium]|nr:hypothetical protein [Chloroflexota bacterium]
MKHSTSALVVVLTLILTLACSLGSLPGSGEDTGPQTESPPKSEKLCGDDVCDGPENAQNCPEDCREESQGEEEAGEDTLSVSESAATQEEYWLTNPATGDDWYVHVTTPDVANTVLFPALVLVPGGIGDSAGFRRPDGASAVFAQAGYVSVVFDADGRGKTGGEEDFNGHAHQDGLAEVIQFAADLPQVDSDRLALVSYSYGVTMATGTLSRYPDLPILFYLDWEGPAERFDTTSECTPHPNIDFQPCDDDEFWSKREALKFISSVQVPYQRLQTEKDHVQPDVDHALNMIFASVRGDPPWVRLNDLEPDQTYDPNDPPAMIPESDPRSLEALTLDYVEELFGLHHQP